MGLDNGISVVRNDYSNKIKALKNFEESWDKEHKYPFKICYWRKCWNVRKDILLNILNSYEAEDEYYYTLSIKHIEEIIKTLKSYNLKTWEWTDSIWTWPEHKKINRKHIKNLKKLIKLMKKYPLLEVYFYDSY
jgi:hypothetical protein